MTWNRIPGARDGRLVEMYVKYMNLQAGRNRPAGGKGNRKFVEGLEQYPLPRIVGYSGTFNDAWVSFIVVHICTLSEE